MSNTLEEQAGLSREEKLAVAKETLSGPVPLISDAPDPVVDLPRGFFEGGVIRTQAIVRELNGEDEESLSRMKTFSDFYDASVALGTISIDDYDMTKHTLAERRHLLQSLLIGERERLFLAIVKVTYGNEKTLPFTCSDCQTEQEIDLLLDQDLQVQDIDDIKSVYTYTTRKGEKLELRLATGADQMEALGDPKANNAEQNTIILSRCITKVDGGLVVDPVHYARRLTIRDRRAVLEILVDNQPGVELEVKATCVRCQNEQKLSLGWGDLFQG